MSSDPLIGLELGNFRIERLIGRGGMAQVYYGLDIKLQRPVAIKVLDARHQGKPIWAERFVREAQTVATWRHENILQIYYADEQDGLYYFAMEYIDGSDLSKVMVDYVVEDKLVGHDEVVRIGLAIANALDYAHQKGVIHRDVKPANVMVARDGRVILADFGLALDVHQGTIGETFGSANYIAPEQAHSSANAVPQSDLYSLGIILYEMLTGVVPFDDPSPLSVSLQHTTLPPPSPREINPALNVETEAVLLKALSKSPDKRYQAGGELMDALEKALRTSQPALIEPDSQSPPVSLPKSILRKTNWVLWIIAFFVLVAIIVVLGTIVLLITRQLATDSKSPVHPAGEQPSAVSETSTSLDHHIFLPLVFYAAPLALPSVDAAPAAQYPGERHFVVYYNDNSLYLYNNSESNSPVTPLTFERLDASGVPLNHFDGSRWANYSLAIKPERCMRIEISGNTPYLRPSQCNNHYDSRVSINRSNDLVFWTTQNGSRQFRVSWNEKEVARCEIAAGVCEVFLPDE